MKVMTVTGMSQVPEFNPCVRRLKPFRRMDRSSCGLLSSLPLEQGLYLCGLDF